MTLQKDLPAERPLEIKNLHYAKGAKTLSVSKDGPPIAGNAKPLPWNFHVQEGIIHVRYTMDVWLSKSGAFISRFTDPDSTAVLAWAVPACLSKVGGLGRPIRAVAARMEIAPKAQASNLASFLRPSGTGPEAENEDE